MLTSQQLIALFPYTSNKELAERAGCSIVSISRFARSHGLTKCPAYKSQIQSRRTVNRVFTDESREKIRHSRTGTKMSTNTIDKILATKRQNDSISSRDRHYKWKGGKPWERFKSPEYVAWRTIVLERDNYTCQDCNTVRSKNEKGLAAHHLKPYASYPELRYEPDNGICLCRSCHMERHGRSFIVETVQCRCGCGMVLNPKDKYGRKRMYINHHHRRGKAMNGEGDSNENTEKPLRHVCNEGK